MSNLSRLVRAGDDGGVVDLDQEWSSFSRSITPRVYMGDDTIPKRDTWVIACTVWEMSPGGGELEKTVNAYLREFDTEEEAEEYLFDGGGYEEAEEFAKELCKDYFGVTVTQTTGIEGAGGFWYVNDSDELCAGVAVCQYGDRAEP